MVETRKRTYDERSDGASGQGNQPSKKTKSNATTASTKGNPKTNTNTNTKAAAAAPPASTFRMSTRNTPASTAAPSTRMSTRSTSTHTTVPSTRMSTRNTPAPARTPAPTLDAAPAPVKKAKAASALMEPKKRRPQVPPTPAASRGTRMSTRASWLDPAPSADIAGNPLVSPWTRTAQAVRAGLAARMMEADESVEREGENNDDPATSSSTKGKAPMRNEDIPTDYEDATEEDDALFVSANEDFEMPDVNDLTDVPSTAEGAPGPSTERPHRSTRSGTHRIKTAGQTDVYLRAMKGPESGDQEADDTVRQRPSSTRGNLRGSYEVFLDYIAIRTAARLGTALPRVRQRIEINFSHFIKSLKRVVQTNSLKCDRCAAVGKACSHDNVNSCDLCERYGQLCTITNSTTFETKTLPAKQPLVAHTNRIMALDISAAETAARIADRAWAAGVHPQPAGYMNGKRVLGNGRLVDVSAVNAKARASIGDNVLVEQALRQAGTVRTPPEALLDTFRELIRNRHEIEEIEVEPPAVPRVFRYHQRPRTIRLNPDGTRWLQPIAPAPPTTTTAESVQMPGSSLKYPPQLGTLTHRVQNTAPAPETATAETRAQNHASAPVETDDEETVSMQSSPSMINTILNTLDQARSRNNALPTAERATAGTRQVVAATPRIRASVGSATQALSSIVKEANILERNNLVLQAENIALRMQITRMGGAVDEQAVARATANSDRVVQLAELDNQQRGQQLLLEGPPGPNLELTDPAANLPQGYENQELGEFNTQFVNLSSATNQHDFDTQLETQEYAENTALGFELFPGEDEEMGEAPTQARSPPRGTFHKFKMITTYPWPPQGNENRIPRDSKTGFVNLSSTTEQHDFDTQVDDQEDAEQRALIFDPQYSDDDEMETAQERVRSPPRGMFRNFRLITTSTIDESRSRLVPVNAQPPYWLPEHGAPTADEPGPELIPGPAPASGPRLATFLRVPQPIAPPLTSGASTTYRRLQNRMTNTGSSTEEVGATHTEITLDLASQRVKRSIEREQASNPEQAELIARRWANQLEAASNPAGRKFKATEKDRIRRQREANKAWLGRENARKEALRQSREAETTTYGIYITPAPDATAATRTDAELMPPPPRPLPNFSQQAEYPQEVSLLPQHPQGYQQAQAYQPERPRTPEAPPVESLDMDMADYDMPDYDPNNQDYLDALASLDNATAETEYPNDFTALLNDEQFRDNFDPDQGGWELPALPEISGLNENGYENTKANESQNNGHDPEGL